MLAEVSSGIPWNLLPSIETSLTLSRVVVAAGSLVGKKDGGAGALDETGGSPPEFTRTVTKALVS